MSNEVKKARTIADIQQEYTQVCTRAGHLQYNIKALSKDLEQVNNLLGELNLEAIKTKAAEDEATKAASAQLETPKAEVASA